MNRSIFNFFNNGTQIPDRIPMKTVTPLLLLPAVALSFNTPPKNTLVWKDGAKAAVCLTYDDGMQTQLDNAIPQLDEFGLKGTFFINSVQGSSAIVGWKNAAQNGHELGNHSLFHPCPLAFGWPEEIASDDYTIPQILKEIRTVNMLLSNLNPEQKKYAYSYPCNQTEVGGKSYVDALRKSRLVECARGGSGEERPFVSDFSTFNKMNVPSWAVPENVELKELIAFVEQARAQGGLAVLQFHGVGGQWIAVSGETHRAFLQYLSEKKADYWVGTFSEIVGYINANR